MRPACMGALPKRWRPRFGGVRVRGGSLRLGRRPAVHRHFRLYAASTPPARCREAPRRSPPSVATLCRACRPAGTRTRSASWPGAPGRGAQTESWVSLRAMPLAPLWGVWPAEPRPAPLCAPPWWSRRHGARGERAVALPRDAAHGPPTPARATQHRPLGQSRGRGAGRGGRALGVVRHGQTLPRHLGGEAPPEAGKAPGRTQVALGSALRHREVRQEKCLTLGGREVARHR